MPYPAATPATEASSPSTAASPMWLRKICRREAPSARKSADSRIRWAAMTSEALWMLRPATSSAIPANTPRNARKKLRNALFTAAICSLVACWPVMTWVPLGTTARTAPASRSWLMPGPALATTAVSWSLPRSSSCWALARVNATYELPPSLGWVP